MSLSDSAWTQNIGSVAPFQHFSENGHFHSIAICLASSFFLLHFSCFPPAQCGCLFMVLKRMGVFFVAVSAVHAKTTTDAPLVGHFGCSLVIGCCLLAQLRS